MRAFFDNDTMARDKPCQHATRGLYERAMVPARQAVKFTVYTFILELSNASHGLSSAFVYIYAIIPQRLFL